MDKKNKEEPEGRVIVMPKRTDLVKEIISSGEDEYEE